MTLEEATVALKHGLPVIVNDKNLEYGDGEFTITNLTKAIPKYEKNFMYSAGITRNGRCIYNLPINYIEPHPDYIDTYEMLIEELHGQNLKYDIAVLLDKGGNKTTICKTVREIIDKIKKANA